MEYLMLIGILVGIGVAIGTAIGKSLADDSEARRIVKKEWEFKQQQEKQGRELKGYHQHREQEFSAMVDQARVFYCELEQGMLRGRQWLANAFAEFVDTRNLDVECWLAVKPRPAAKAADQVADIRRRFRDAVKSMKLLEYQVSSYEEYFPFLVEYRDAIIDESVDLRGDAAGTLERSDPALTEGYLSKSEYDKLPTEEKYQFALDRYWGRNKSQREIGRVYERFVGHLYEQEGWRVAYHGIVKGYEDFGRDLICRRANDIHIVQCKCWAKDKTIHEKHIFQLFGTTVLFALQCDRDSARPRQKEMAFLDALESRVTPVFATTTKLSEDATAVAKHLDISIRSEPLRRYPMIKCNVNPSTNEKIYHLPFDQQYDKIIVGDIKGEFYAETIAEAESAGFRRAFRWRGDRQDQRA